MARGQDYWQPKSLDEAQEIRFARMRLFSIPKRQSGRQTNVALRFYSTPRIATSSGRGIREASRHRPSIPGKVRLRAKHVSPSPDGRIHLRLEVAFPAGPERPSPKIVRGLQ